MQNSSSQPGFFAAFFSFKKMVSPFFIGIVYFLGLIAIIGGTGMALWKGPHSAMYMLTLNLDGPMVIIPYVLVVLVGLIMILFWRFVCELLIVTFGIFNRLADIKGLLHEPVKAAVSASRVQATIAPTIPSVEDAKAEEVMVEEVAEPAVEVSSKSVAHETEELAKAEPETVEVEEVEAQAIEVEAEPVEAKTETVEAAPEVEEVEAMPEPDPTIKLGVPIEPELPKDDQTTPSVIALPQASSESEPESEQTSEASESSSETIVPSELDSEASTDDEDDK